ncbi:MAG: glycoside hydrolase family 5 protein [Fibrobacter sp.]|nr:glycoside hydrolase family 5 protein [Fibrobacter sp.]
MKFKHFGLFAALPLLAMTACSDDSSSSGNNVVDQPVVDSLQNPIPGYTDPNVNPGTTIPGGTVTQPGVTDPGIGGNGGSTVVDDPTTEPEVNIADTPISEDEKKDDGTGSVNSLAFSIKGVAEGPFLEGSTVKVSSVDIKTMAPTTEAASSKVSSKLGGYSASGNLTSAVASIEVNGKFLNTSTGETNGTTTMKAYVDLRDRSSANVNLLTTLEYDRIQYLVSQKGLSFTAAKSRAHKEVLAAMGFVQDSTQFEDISIYNRNAAAVNLLAITVVSITERSVTDFNAAVASIAADIALDGKWDDMSLKASLADFAYTLDIGYPKFVIEDWNNNADIEYFKGMSDYFWAEQYGLGSCGPKNQNEIKPNANTVSVNASSMFLCVDSAWQVASDKYLANYLATQLFGACTESNAGDMKANAEGNYFVCKKSLWAVATDADMKSMEIASSKGACNATSEGKVVSHESAYYMCISSTWTKLAKTPVDYSKGRAMNKKLGRGVNFGNSWDAPGTGDGAWSNPIGDGDFAAVKSAGFNSVRLPVRWSAGVDAQLNGVKEDVQLALKAGLTVIVNSHHHDNLYSAAKNGNFDGALQNFANEWKKVAQAFDSFPDDALVFEIFNEPHDMTQDQVNKIMTTGYNAIRSVSKGKTIMFESNGYAKFAMIPKLDLPNDGNIIVTGHYYEPYTFTHQGHGYDCNGNAKDGISAMPGHFSSYYEEIALTFPDINGGTVPINMGEFGVANKGSCSAISDAKREAWTDAVVAQAEKYGMSWHYWCYKNCGGFEASNGGSWHGNMLNVFKKYFK